jgi:uncharacterized protein YndB with AHSA1/START domain
VFAFLTDARNNPLWQAKAGLKATRQEPEEPVGVGTRITETWHFLGRKTEVTREVTEYELNHKCTARYLWDASPIKEGILLFEPVTEGTRCTFTTLIQAGGVFAFTEPILASTLKKAMETSLAKAKQVLETRR